jgi:hypothetical protein
LALVHDDAEIIVGDVQAGNKSKMTPEELAEVKKKEREALEVLPSCFPELNTEVYKALLIEAFEKKTLEAMVLDWADKMDAFGEALHELYAGHELWTTQVINEYGVIELPTDYYTNYFHRFQEKFPQSEKLFEKGDPIFRIPDKPSPDIIVENRVSHHKDSFETKTGFFPYDFWIAVTFKYGNKEDIESLYNKKE